MAKDEFVLIIGNLNIPFKHFALFKNFKEYFVADKITNVISLGNVGSQETLNMIQKISSNLTLVRGCSDDFEGIPSKKNVNINNYKISITNGIDIIPKNDKDVWKILQRETNCDILIYGGNGKQESFKEDNINYINPGSPNGSNCIGNYNLTPSFTLLKLSENKEESMIYEYKYDERCKNNMDINKKNLSDN